MKSFRFTLKPMNRIIVTILFSIILLGGCSPGSQSDDSEQTEETATSSFPVISRGEKVTLSKHLASDKYTVFKFTADW